MTESGFPALPPREAAVRLSAWLAAPRARALRRVGIGHRRRVLDAGAGWGDVTAELARRCAGSVVALDRSPGALTSLRAAGFTAVAGDLQALPCGDGSFDLVFFQNALLWATHLPRALREAARVLRPGGALVALEPDYGGMLEHPDRGLGRVWRDALGRAGADPLTGRRLPGAVAAAGLRVEVELLPAPRPFDADALTLLEGLPLTAEERRTVTAIVNELAPARGEWQWFVHVPYFVIVAEKS